MSKIRAGFLMLLLVGMTPAFAQNFKPVQDPEKVLAELQKVSQRTSTIQASFTEEKSLAVLKEPERSSGSFFFKQKDKMRWEQKTPAAYVILINGDQLRIKEGNKEKNLKQAGRMAGQIKELMVGLVNGDFQQNQAFSQTVLGNADSYLIELTPVNRRLKNIYAKITLLFPKSSLRLKELTFFEKGGDKSLMKFNNEKFNLTLDDSLFQKL